VARAPGPEESRQLRPHAFFPQCFWTPLFPLGQAPPDLAKECFSPFFRLALSEGNRRLEFCKRWEFTSKSGLDPSGLADSLS